MDLSIIIVNYRCWKRLGECLDKIASFNGKKFEFEVVIVDNNSSDGVLDTFRKRYSSVFNFLENRVNGGFANGCNLGASNAKGDFLLFLNPDTVAEEESVFNLLERAKQRSGQAAISCCQVNSMGKESKGYGNFLKLGMLTGTGRAIARIIKGKKMQPKSSGNMIFPDWISGSVILIRKDFFEQIGGFDEDFWMYFEDMDLSLQVRHMDGEIVYFTDFTITHNHGGSSRINLRTTALTKTEVMISRHVYIAKNFSGIEKVMSQSILVLGGVISGIINGFIGTLFFFVRKIFVRALISLNLFRYYLGALKRMSWVSPRSVNWQKNINN
jgi:GT2 family glycosyltransferase